MDRLADREHALNLRDSRDGRTERHARRKRDLRIDLDRPVEHVTQHEAQRPAPTGDGIRGPDDLETDGALVRRRRPRPHAENGPLETGDEPRALRAHGDVERARRESDDGEARCGDVDVAIGRGAAALSGDVHMGARRTVPTELRSEQCAHHGDGRRRGPVAAIGIAQRGELSEEDVGGRGRRAEQLRAKERGVDHRASAAIGERRAVLGAVDVTARRELDEAAEALGQVRGDRRAMGALREGHQRARHPLRIRIFAERPRRFCDVGTPARRHGGSRCGLDVERVVVTDAGVARACVLARVRPAPRTDGLRVLGVGRRRACRRQQTRARPKRPRHAVARTARGVVELHERVEATLRARGRVRRDAGECAMARGVQGECPSLHADAGLERVDERIGRPLPLGLERLERAGDGIVVAALQDEARRARDAVPVVEHDAEVAVTGRPCGLRQHARLARGRDLPRMTEHVVGQARSPRDEDDSSFPRARPANLHAHRARAVRGDVDVSWSRRGSVEDRRAFCRGLERRVHERVGPVANEHRRLDHVALDPPRAAVDAEREGEIASDVRRRGGGRQSVGHADERDAPRRLCAAERDRDANATLRIGAKGRRPVGFSARDPGAASPCAMAERAGAAEPDA